MGTILLESNAHAERFKAGAKDLSTQRQGGSDYGKWWQTQGRGVRRPGAGVELKQDTVAQLFVVDGDDGTTVPLFSRDNMGNISGVPFHGTSWTNFTLQRVEESRAEKMQLVETFGESYVFFYGEQPRTLRCSGVLTNYRNYNWRAEFWKNYDKHFRGTRLVERNARIYMIYDDIWVQGFMFNANAQDICEYPHQIPFSFSILVHRYENFGSIANIAPTQSDLVKDSLLTGLAILNLGRGGFEMMGDKRVFETHRGTRDKRGMIENALTQLLIDSGKYKDDASARAVARQIASSENENALNTRLKNLQAKSGSSFMEALKDFFIDPARMFNLAKSIRQGDGGSVAAGVGYAVFNAGATASPIMKALDPLALGAMGAAKMSSMGVNSDDALNNVFNKGNFTATGLNLGNQVIDSNASGVAAITSGL